MTDTNLIDSTMNGAPYKAGQHAATLRRMLWREHLGLLPAQDLDATDEANAQPPSDNSPNEWYSGDPHDTFVADPLSDSLWDLWTTRASTNTEVFRHLFHADPDDYIRTFDDYQNFLPRRGGVKQGHLFDPFRPAEDIRRDLDKIKGHLVWMPLKFLDGANMAETGLAVNSYTESIYT